MCKKIFLLTEQCLIVYDQGFNRLFMKSNVKMVLYLSEKEIASILSPK